MYNIKTTPGDRDELTINWSLEHKRFNIKFSFSFWRSLRLILSSTQNSLFTMDASCNNVHVDACPSLPLLGSFFGSGPSLSVPTKWFQLWTNSNQSFKCERMNFFVHTKWLPKPWNCHCGVISPVVQNIFLFNLDPPLEYAISRCLKLKSLRGFHQKCNLVEYVQSTRREKGVEDYNRIPTTRSIRTGYGKGDVPSTQDPQCYTTKNNSPLLISFGLTWSNYQRILWYVWNSQVIQVEKEDGTTLGQELVCRNENRIHIVRDLNIPL